MYRKTPVPESLNTGGLQLYYERASVTGAFM